MSTTTTITVGFTVTDRANDYVPSMDGWRPEAAQEVVMWEVPDNGLTVEEWAEAVFVATNAPPGIHVQDGATDIVRAMLAGRRAPRSLSVGDTVTVHGRTVECARGAEWREVARR